MSEPIAFKWFQGAQARSVAAYDDGSTCTLTNSDSHQPAIAIRTAQTGANGIGIDNELAHTIDTTGPEAVTYMLKLRHTGSENIGGGQGAMWGEDVSYTLATGQDQTMFQPHEDHYVVRRLTPMECERLQGMPSDHTKVPYRGKPADECPDGPRYKAIGNSMAVPCMAWIGERIQAVDELTAEQDEEE